MFHSFLVISFRMLWLGLCILVGFGVVSTWAQITEGSISISVSDLTPGTTPIAAW